MSKCKINKCMNKVTTNFLSYCDSCQSNRIIKENKKFKSRNQIIKDNYDRDREQQQADMPGGFN